MLGGWWAHGPDTPGCDVCDVGRGRCPCWMPARNVKRTWVEREAQNACLPQTPQFLRTPHRNRRNAFHLVCPLVRRIMTRCSLALIEKSLSHPCSERWDRDHKTLRRPFRAALRQNTKHTARHEPQAQNAATKSIWTVRDAMTRHMLSAQHPMCWTIKNHALHYNTDKRCLWQETSCPGGGSV